MLGKRLLTAALGIPLGLAVMWLGGWALAAAIALIAVLGVWELLRLAGAPRGRMLFAGLGGGFLYVVIPLSYLPRLRSLSFQRVGHPSVPAGAMLLFLAVGACWATDAAAYFVGRRIGKHKLAPKISPGKTVEGGIAGLVGGMVFVGALGTWVGIAPRWAVGLGALLAVAAQAGDLFESWLKRRAGVKDSGALLPGHGGVLDRFDSLLFVAPVAYYCLRALLELK